MTYVLTREDNEDTAVVSVFNDKVSKAWRLIENAVSTVVCLSLISV